MKFSAQLQIRLTSEIRERFTNEDSLLHFVKGLFIKKLATIHEETFSAPDILSRLSAAFKDSGVYNLVRISHDDTEYYLDKANEPNDLERVLSEFTDTIRNSFERFYEEISIIMEIKTSQIDFIIELNMMRVHPIGQFPILIYIYGIPEKAIDKKTETDFQLFVSRLEQNIYKYLEIADLQVIYAKNYDNFPTGENQKDETEDFFDEADTDTQCKFFPLYGVMLGETTIDKLAKSGVKSMEYNSNQELYKYYTINDMRFWHNDKIATHIYLTYTSPLPRQWRICGLDWNLSYNEISRLFKQLGYMISIAVPPKTEWYNGRKTLVAEFHATKRIKKNIQLTIEVYFNYSQKSSVSARGTLYSLRFRAV